MKNYIAQLISDITQAHLPAQNETEKISLTFEEEMELIENYATGTNIPPILSIACSLSPDQFPPEEKLEDEEIRQIINAFDQMLLSRNMCIDLPKEIPLRKAYPIIINVLNREAWYFPTGTMHLDFCTGYAPECELGEYCQCLDYCNEKTEGNGKEE